MLLAETTGTGMAEFVSGVTGSVTGAITMAQVGAIVAAIVGAGIVAIFAWKFGRKGFRFVVNALSGRAGKI